MTQTLRVLMVSGEYPPLEGGVGDYTYLLGQEMVRQGAQVTVLTSSGAGEQRVDGEVLCLPWVEKWNLAILPGVLKRAAQVHQPDIVLIQYQTAAFQLKPAINLLPTLLPEYKFAVTFHDLREPYLFPKAGKLRKWVTFKLARSCRIVITTNIEDQRKLMSDTKIRQLALIPIGSNIPLVIDPLLRAKMRQRFNLGTFQYVLGYFGLINESKGVEELVQALALVRQEGINAGMCIIGGGIGASDATNAPYLAKLQHAIAENGLEPYVRWTGHLTSAEVSAALQCVDIAVLPYQDGVSLRRGSLMAALAHGLPIVTTFPASPMPEFSSGISVELAPAKDVASLAKAIIKVVYNADLRMQLGQRAAVLAEKFAWPEITKQTLEVLHAAVER
ncbi:MAG: glycosyltransferase family 4 protein [Chloroflexi bacterium]|nr:glycosyltransferase family 4 protein [Chloroflexota bacterium]